MKSESVQIMITKLQTLKLCNNNKALKALTSKTQQYKHSIFVDMCGLWIHLSNTVVVSKKCGRIQDCPLRIQPPINQTLSPPLYKNQNLDLQCSKDTDTDN